jgi:hypothetical protein
MGAWLPQAMRWLLRLLMQLVIFPLILMWTAVQHGRPRVLLVQTPPAVPTLLICWLMRLCLWCRVVLDYHNIAYTIMRGQAEHSGTGSPHLLKSDRFSVRHVSVRNCVPHGNCRIWVQRVTPHRYTVRVDLRTL